MLFIGRARETAGYAANDLGYSSLPWKRAAWFQPSPSVLYHRARSEDPAAIPSGDYTYRFEDGKVVTHRIISVLQTEDGRRTAPRADNQKTTRTQTPFADRVIGTMSFS